jgi:hypothetical protein
MVLFETCDLLGFYAAYVGNSLPTFQDKLQIIRSFLKMGPIGFPEKSVRNYHYTQCNNPKDPRFYYSYNIHPKLYVFMS